jgi:hypothetical protein
MTICSFTIRSRCAEKSATCVSARPQLAQSNADASNKKRILNNNTQRDREKTLLLKRRSLLIPGSAGCQPAPVGSLPTGICARQAAEHCGLAARAPRNARALPRKSAAKFSVSFVFFVVNFTSQ